MHTIKRSVESNELVSTDFPRLRVQIDPALHYIGNLNDTVSDHVTIDNYFFVDQDTDGIIRRVLYFQFEATSPLSEQTFAYRNIKPIEIGNHQFGYDGGVRPYHASKIAEQAESSDVRKTVDFLDQQGVRFSEGEFYATLRFVDQFDESQHKDMLIIYLEHVQEADVPEDVIAKSRYSDEWQAYCDQLLARARRTFTICED